MKFDPLSHDVIGCALEVHRRLGPGLLESTYQQCLARELALAKIPFALQVGLPVEYKGIRLECGYRIDLFVQDRLIVELKSIEAIAPVHLAQLLTYLKLAHVHVGLLINFNVPVLKHGIRRLVL